MKPYSSLMCVVSFTHASGLGDMCLLCLYRGLEVACFCVHRLQPVVAGAAGRDATQDFEEIGHSNSARSTLAKYFIGNFEVRPSPVGPCML
jgi:hypothetical protein